MKVACKCCVLSLALYIVAGTSAPSCKSDSGSNVDFAYAFKYPKGFDYAYMDSSNKLAKSSHALNTASSSITKTLMQMHSSGVSSVLWNDEFPTGPKTSAPNAHSKGVLIFTSAGGLWLTHSLPKFPAAGGTSASGMWADGAENYGQSYLCITVGADAISKLGPLFKITRPSVYSSKFAGGDDEFPTLKEVVNKQWDTTTMTSHVSISSKGGQAFTVYGKAGAWGVGKDLYSDLVAPAVGKLWMQGWRHGAGVWGPACGKNEVLDVSAVSFPEQDWTTMDDHSKWAVGESGSVFCVGDLNRADGQDKRGGATVCIKDASIAAQMRKVVSTEDKCGGDIVMMV